MKLIHWPIVIALVMPSAAMVTALGRVEFVPVADGASDAEVRAIATAAEIAYLVKISDCFRRFMSTRRLIDTNGRTPGEVASHLQQLSGTIPVALYFRCLAGSRDCASPTSPVAYRQPPDNTIYLNRAYYDLARGDFDIYELAGSLAHEAIGHALGRYDHSYEWTPHRDWSVPYSISGASRDNDDAFRHCRSPLGFDEFKR